MKMYVGNLPYSVNDTGLKEMFEGYGPVHSANVILDRETGRSRGFGFIEMDDDAGTTAIAEMNGKAIDGRPLVVNEARPREPRSGGGGGGGGGFGRRERSSRGSW